ncbi:hypothetical protein LXL04_022032 [Taraxacum kok-saghyz]
MERRSAAGDLLQRRHRCIEGGGITTGDVSSVKKEEVESKVSAWQNAKIAKINNRFKRDDAIISGWENEQVQNSTSWMKKVEVKCTGEIFLITKLPPCWVKG